MRRLVRAALAQVVIAACLMALAPLAQAGLVPVSALMAGQSTIVEVVDPAIPSLRVETTAAGSGLAGPIALLGYRSGDVVNFSTGAGQGQNVFTADNGDELFGDFTVQMVPLDDGSFQLFGQVAFAGGSGRFAGASGAADFTGAGQFIDAARALTRFEFTGRVKLVPAPATLGLLMLGLFAVRIRHVMFKSAATRELGPRIAALVRSLIGKV